MSETPPFWPRPVVSAARGATWCAGVIVLLFTLLISADVMIRALTGATVIDSFEWSSYGFAVSVALGLPYSVLTAAHIRINVAQSARSRLVRLAADLAAFTSMALFALCLAYYGFITFRESLAYGTRSNSTLAIPLAIPQAIWVAGLAAFAAASLYALVRGLGWLWRRHDIDLATAAQVPEGERSADMGGSA